MTYSTGGPGYQPAQPSNPYGTPSFVAQHQSPTRARWGFTCPAVSWC